RARRSARRRVSLPGGSLPRAGGGRRRREGESDLGGVDPREDGARRRDAAAPRPLPPVRLRRAQGLSDAGAPEGAAALRRVRGLPAQLRAGARAARALKVGEERAQARAFGRRQEQGPARRDEAPEARVETGIERGAANQARERSLVAEPVVP